MSKLFVSREGFRWTDIVGLSSGAFIGPEMVLGYLISNNKSLYGIRLFYILFICFLRHLPKKVAQNPFWAPKTHLKHFWAIGPPNIKKVPNSTTLVLIPRLWESTRQPREDSDILRHQRAYHYKVKTPLWWLLNSGTPKLGFQYLDFRAP